ncbi:hypothetical protein MHB50_18920 [Siminovitchia sp. FSL H7-0308]|uniref:Uncharacterized protein n=1 Tax=Siminovitchia thermophila TaxID=1245522 RepID=A0ABS2RAB3_9BACI|nr:hypothetical protein [Siminovitchia thermophila]MBM7716592.1 hypothetical protein [Siminovitchia thermophila]ONK21516.1 hypothetical protein BLX87_21945 [Bacillus sp. VT-16-64]
MGSENYVLKLLLAILLTSAAYFLGDAIIAHKLFIWQTIVIGATVVLAGAFVEKIHAPMWLIIITPFPIGMTLLYVFLNETTYTWFITYALTLFIYVIIHVIASSLFRFHSLIPAWKLRKE